eukprot:10999706-Lingulodinium_polyedra.AAC.1
MLYNMLEARVLHEIESTARSHGLSCGLPSVEAPLAEAVGLVCDSNPVLEDVYADDALFMTVGD